VVVAQEGQDLPPVEGGRVVRDPIPNAGPLVGLVAGLRAFAESGAPIDWIWVATTDAPLVRAEVVRRLVALGDGWDAVVADVRGKRHVLSAVYRPSVLGVAEALVGEGERRASALSERVRTRIATAEELVADEAVARMDPGLETFTNVNTIAELEQVRTR
jgi:molybdopterin-guanine dinucleotide biosynthesis protein A